MIKAVRHLNFFHLVIVFLLFFLSCSLPTQANAQPNSKIVFATKEMPPYISKDLDDFGPLAKKLREIFLKKNIDLVFQFYTSARSLKQLTDGYVDGALPFDNSFKIAQNYLLSKPLIEEETCLYYFGNNHPAPSENSNLKQLLTKKSLGISSDDEISDVLSRIGADNLRIETNSSKINNLKKLKNGRIHFLAITKREANYYIQKYFSNEATQFHSVALPLKKSSFSLIVSPHSKWGHKIREIVGSADFNDQK